MLRKYNFFLKQIKYDFLIFLREPFFALPILLLPALFFVIYAEIYSRPGVDIASFGNYIPMYVLLISFLTVFFNIGLQSVSDRETGVYKRIIISPTNIFFIVGTYVVRGVIISIVGLIEMFVIAKFVYGIPLTDQMALFVFIFILIVGIMLLLSLSLHGFFKNSRQVVPFTILSFQYVLFASGMMFPIEQVPAALRYFVYMNPVYHMNQVLVSIWNATSMGIVNVLALLAVIAICVFILSIQKRASLDYQ